MKRVYRHGKSSCQAGPVSQNQICQSKHNIQGETALENHVPAKSERVRQILLRERVPITAMGETNIYLAYCRDNKRTSEVLSRELDGLDDEFTTLKFLSQELQVRAQSIRFQKAA